MIIASGNRLNLLRSRFWRGLAGDCDKFAESPQSGERAQPLGFPLLLGGGAILERDCDRAQHIAGGSRLPVQISNCRAACCTNISTPGMTAIPLARATCSRWVLDRVVHHAKTTRAESPRP